MLVSVLLAPFTLLPVVVSVTHSMGMIMVPVLLALTPVLLFEVPVSSGDSQLTNAGIDDSTMVTRRGFRQHRRAI